MITFAFVVSLLAIYGAVLGSLLDIVPRLRENGQLVAVGYGVWILVLYAAIAYVS